MDRFYCPLESITEHVITIIDQEQINHIKGVLRYRVTDTIVVFDGKGSEYRGAIESMDKQQIRVAVKAITRKKEADPRIAMAVAIPKNVKMDYIVEKLTELGVNTIIPLLTERTIVKLDERARLEKAARWQKIAIRSSEQSQRFFIPEVAAVEVFDDALRLIKNYDVCCLPHLSGERKNISEILKEKKFRSILAFVGPEGDFSPREVKKAIQGGAIAVSLGDNVLRVDTAAIAVASFIRFSRNA